MNRLPQGFLTIARVNLPLAEKIAANDYFLDMDDLAGVIAANRLLPVLVRCGCGRFTCAAQDVAHFVAIVGNSGDEYVRDVALIAQHQHQEQPPARTSRTAATSRVIYRDDEYGGALGADGQVYSDADPGL